MHEFFCPQCKNLLSKKTDNNTEYLFCDSCNRKYSIQQGIPIFGKELPKVTEEYWESRDDTKIVETRLVEFLPADRRFDKILDLGCGDGRSTLPISELGNVVYGLDSSWMQLVHLHAKNQKSIVPINGDAKQLPFPDDYFDLIISLSVVEHIPKNDLPTIFAEAYRTLKSDGLFLVRNDAWFYRVLEVLRIRPSMFGVIPDATHINMMTGGTFAHRLRTANFKIIQEDHFPFYRYEKKHGIKFPRFLKRIFATHSNFICTPIKD